MNTSTGNVKMYKRRLDRWKFREANFSTVKNLFSLLWSSFSEPIDQNHYSNYPGKCWKLNSLWNRRIDSVIKFSSRSV